MKKIEAIIKPHRLEEVRNALSELGIVGLTAWEVRGFGRQRGHQELYRGSEYQVSFIPKLRLDVVVPDDVADSVVLALEKAANTGTIGDGKVFVYDCLAAVRIRTGERGDDAL
jgi:nitrogen regulatory protein PII